ncbi:MAG: hypothetical protein WDN50_03575 [Bradyrhizobium sp.]
MIEINRKESQMTDQSAASTAIPAHRLQIEYWPLDRLIPYARNARKHSPAQVAEIAGAFVRSASPIRSWSARARM